MKTLKFIMALVLAGIFFTACTKEGPLLNYKTGDVPMLQARFTPSNPQPRDSNQYVYRSTWSYPDFGTEVANMKFITQIDVVGNNFANPLTSTVLGSFYDSIQAKVINKFLLDRGYAFGASVPMESRLIASYANNNDLKISNSVPLTFVVYKVPPKVALPSTGRLFLVGNATQGGWNNPVPAPSQEFARINETTFSGVFQLNGGAQYLALPVNGSWDNKYAVANNSLAGLSAGGDFGFNFNDNFPAPAADGIYKITFDFQTGKFSVTPFTQVHGLPTTLVVVGGASPWGWNNSTDNPQTFTQLNSAEWVINSINLKANDGYLILPEPGNSNKKYGVPNRDLESARLEGTFVPEGQDFRSPTTAGNYRILMNFATETYKLTKL